MQDLFFYYKYTVRFILFLKKSNTRFFFTDILELNKVIIYFNIKNLTDLNNLAISNYYFFFKYFFGKIPFFFNYKYTFKLNISYFNFIILSNIIKKQIYYILFFFINDIYTIISKKTIDIKNFDFYWEFTVNDMNFFIEKKNSIGFFNLKDNITFKFMFNEKKFLQLSNFFKIYKL